MEALKAMVRAPKVSMATAVREQHGHKESMHMWVHGPRTLGKEWERKGLGWGRAMGREMGI